MRIAYAIHAANFMVLAKVSLDRVVDFLRKVGLYFLSLQCWRKVSLWFSHVSSDIGCGSTLILQRMFQCSGMFASVS